ncbi:MAG TPA: chemotaxis protein CheW [Clostridiales bacterium UBA8153]|nr:chemotaxis protein CheW [Clostridiales bacterium UBA8153]
MPVSGGELQLVVFELAGESYGVDIGQVREIIVMQKITRVPRTPAFVEGIINLRGKVIPVVDLRQRLGLAAERQGSGQERIVVVEHEAVGIGLVVDAVSEVLRVPLDTVEPPSPVITGTDMEYLEGVAKLDRRLVILLNLDRVLANGGNGELAAVD